MSYTFLLFDLDHTLLDFDLAEDLALTEMLEEQGVKDTEGYKDYYKPMNKQMWRDLEAGLLTKKELVETRFSKLFAHFGQEVDGLYLAECYQEHLSQQGQTYEGAHELLKTLKDKGFQIYGATNGITKIQTGRMANSGLNPYFTRVFISEQAGTQKPHADFYTYIAHQIPDFDDQKALMIGDSLTADVQGGNNAGIDTAWYNPNNLENHTSAKPTYVVKTYQDLEDLLSK